MSEEDIKYMRMAIEEARKCKGEDSRVHPKVGALIVLNGSVIATAHRGEIGEGQHAEFTALEKKLSTTSVAGATVYTTLEPCTARNHPKVPCAFRLIERRVRRVVIGMLDPNPNICGRGLWLLREANVATDLFPHDLMCEIEELNREFIREHRPKEFQTVVAPVPNLGGASEEPTKETAPAKTAVIENTSGNAFPAFLRAMKNGELEAGKKLYQELTDSEENPEVKSRMRVIYLDLRYRATQDEANYLEITSLLQDDVVGDYAASKLAYLSLLAHDLKGASDFFAKATSLAKSPERRIGWVVEHARVLLNQEAENEALALLLTHLKGDYSPQSKSTLFKTLSSIFEKRGEKPMSVALLARAAQLGPLDRTTRFSAAYGLATIGFGHLALSLYDCLRQFPDQDPVVLNNIGAQCLDFGMPIKAVKYFREAAEYGNSLAKANLAFGYLKAGFVDEAEMVLQAARKEESPHENVGHAMVAIANRLKEEEKQWQESMRLGNREQLFLSRFIEAIGLPDGSGLGAFSGVWEGPDEAELTLVSNGHSVTGEWGGEYQNKRLTITPYGNAGVCEYENLGLYVTYFERCKNGFAFLDKGKQVLEVLHMENNKPVLMSWKRKDKRLLSANPVY